MRWIAAMMRSFVIYFFLSILITVFGSITFSPRRAEPNFLSKSLFTFVNSFVIFSVCLIYSLQVTTFTILLSQFFSKCIFLVLFIFFHWLVLIISLYKHLMLKYLSYSYGLAQALTFSTLSILQTLNTFFVFCLILD